MKKTDILIIFSLLVFFGCSGLSELKENISPSNRFQYNISKLALKLDDSFRFIKLRQKKLKINKFTSLKENNSVMGDYLKLKLEEELFKLGYIISSDSGVIEVNGKYIDLGNKIEIIASIKGEGIKIAESSVVIKKDNTVGKLLNENQNGFLTSER